MTCQQKNLGSKNRAMERNKLNLICPKEQLAIAYLSDKSRFILRKKKKFKRKERKKEKKKESKERKQSK